MKSKKKPEAHQGRSERAALLKPLVRHHKFVRGAKLKVNLPLTRRKQDMRSEGRLMREGREP
eukprot:5081117-Prorocentrum_lima.AAC.1